MYDIVGIGANVCDTLMNVCEYPEEDTKLRADNVTISGGGPCATGLVAASKFGAVCAYIGNLTDDNSGKFLKEDFEKYKVSVELVRIKKGYTSFSSCISCELFIYSRWTVVSGNGNQIMRRIVSLV